MRQKGWQIEVTRQHIAPHYFIGGSPVLFPFSGIHTAAAEPHSIPICKTTGFLSGGYGGRPTDGGDEGRVESVLRKAEENARLADAAVANQQQLEKVVIRLRKEARY